jgi:hypothetical protein
VGPGPPRSGAGQDHLPGHGGGPVGGGGGNPRLPPIGPVEATHGPSRRAGSLQDAKTSPRIK